MYNYIQIEKSWKTEILYNCIYIKSLKDPSRSRKISFLWKFHHNYYFFFSYEPCHNFCLFSSHWIVWIHDLFYRFALKNVDPIYPEHLNISILFILFTSFTCPKNCGKCFPHILPSNPSKNPMRQVHLVALFCLWKSRFQINSALELRPFN